MNESHVSPNSSPEPAASGGNPGPPHGGMKLTTIRISQASWDAIQEEAKTLDISAAEFIRESVIFRLGYRWAKRADDDHVIQRLREIDRRIDVEHY